MPRLKTTRPIASYKGHFSLSDPMRYPETSISFLVERFPKVVIRRPASASAFVQRNDATKSAGTAESSNTAVADLADEREDLSIVRSARTYQVFDDTAVGGKRDVSREDLEKGYEYGRTAVYIAESDLSVTKMQTQAALEVVGFVPSESVSPFQRRFQ